MPAMLCAGRRNDNFVPSRVPAPAGVACAGWIPYHSPFANTETAQVNKAFVKESDGADDGDEELAPAQRLPAARHLQGHIARKRFGQHFLADTSVIDGIVKALQILGDEANKPLVVRLDGNNVAEGRRILEAANHPLVTLADTMDGAADKAAELANA